MQDDLNFSKVTYEMRLGNEVYLIRHRGYLKEHKEEFAAMGLEFVWKVGQKDFKSIVSI